MPSSTKRPDWPTLLAIREACRREGRTIVWTNGCFDLLHPGHVRSLEAAKALGDVLVVGLNSDASVRALKGPSRPIFGEEDRAVMLSGLSAVDYVIVFPESTPEVSLAKLKPDIHCKGAEYAPAKGKPVPEAALVTSYGGRVEYLPYIPGISTTELVRRIRTAEGL